MSAQVRRMTEYDSWGEGAVRAGYVRVAKHEADRMRRLGADVAQAEAITARGRIVLTLAPCWAVDLLRDSWRFGSSPQESKACVDALFRRCAALDEEAARAVVEAAHAAVVAMGAEP